MAWGLARFGKRAPPAASVKATEPVLSADDDFRQRLDRLEKQSALAEAHFMEGFWKALDMAYDASLPHRQLTCLVCGHSDSRLGYKILEDRCYFGGGRLERYECPKCDCIFGPQKYLDLDENFVSRDYKILYSRYSEGDCTDSEINTFHSLSPSVDGLYVDWGCGGAWSRAVASLRNERWKVIGYEPSAESTGEFVINEREKLPLKFDGIFSNNVIEHFRNPVSQFLEFNDLLNSGAKMAHSSPCYEYKYSHTRFHTVFLLGKSPHVLAERTGFKVVGETREGEYINYVFAKAN